MQTRFGIRVRKRAEARRKPCRTERNRSGDFQIADDLLARVFQRALGDHGRTRHFARELAQRHAWAGEQETACVPLEQRYAHIVLQRSDLTADGGLTDAEFFGGGSQAAGLRRKVESLELVPVHRRTRGPTDGLLRCNIA